DVPFLLDAFRESLHPIEAVGDVVAAAGKCGHDSEPRQVAIVLRIVEEVREGRYMRSVAADNADLDERLGVVRGGWRGHGDQSEEGEKESCGFHGGVLSCDFRWPIGDGWYHSRSKFPPPKVSPETEP